jgi:hypothetical protein
VTETTTRPGRDTGARTALIVATVLALVPWAAIVADAASGSDSPPGRPTTVSCDSAWCFSSLDHVVLSDTVVPAALCAVVAVAVAGTLLVRRQARAWPAIVIALAVVAMAIYAVYA